MPLFHYQARDDQQEPHSGTLQAATAEEARSELERRGLTVDILERADETHANSPGGQLSESEAREVTQGLAELGRRNLPLAPGLKALAEELNSRRLSPVINRVASAVEAGQPLSQALTASGNGFPGHLKGLIEAGEQSGRLADILERYLNGQQLVAELRRTAWTAMAYPLLLLLGAVSIFVVIEIFVLPQFADLFSEFGTELPRFTEFMLWVARSFAWLMSGTLAALVLLWLASVYFLSASARQRLLLRTPLFGPMWSWAYWAEFLQLVALLLEAEIPLPQALALAGAAARDANIRAASEEVKAAVEAGAAMCESDACRRFPPSVVQFLRWGEEQQQVVEGLRVSAEVCIARARMQSGLVVLVAPLFSFLLAIFVLGLVIFSLMLPLMAVIQALS